MKRISASGLGFVLLFVVLSVQAERPGPTFIGTLHVQSDFAGGGPTIDVQNKNAGGDIAINFLSAGGELVGNLGVIRETEPTRFFVQQNASDFPLTLAEDGGNVGIGTREPGTTLHVRNNSEGGPIINVENMNSSGDVPIDFLLGDQVVGNVGAVRATNKGPLRFFVLERNDLNVNLTLAENGGNVGVGTANPDGKLHTADVLFNLGTGNCPPGYMEGDFDGGEGDVDCKADGIVAKADGKVGIGTSNPNFTLEVIGNVGVNGTLVHASDAQMKKDVETIPNALGKVSSLRGVRYEWRTDEFKDRKLAPGKHIGVIAQEVEEVIPELVVTGKNGYKSVAYANLTALLIEALKELRAEKEMLAARVASLEALVAQWTSGQPRVASLSP